MRIRDKHKLVERWKEYVEELYYDERLGMPEIATARTEVKISEEEMEEIIRKLPKNTGRSRWNYSGIDTEQG